MKKTRLHPGALSGAGRGIWPWARRFRGPVGPVTNTTNSTLAKVDEQRREIRHQRTQMRQPLAPSTRRQIHDDDCDEEHERLMDLIHSESHFNSIKIYLLCHFSDHIRQFGTMQMYSMEFGQLAHMDIIKNITLHPGASGSPCAPDAPGPYNLNSSS